MAAVKTGVKLAEKSRWLQIATPQAGYAGDVVTLVARISRTKSGRSILEGIRGSGKVVRIEPPVLPTIPPNAWTRRRDADTPAGVEIVIAFDPADWPNPAQHAPLPADAILFGLLRQALRLGTDAEPSEEPESRLSPELEAYMGERASRP